MVFIFGKPSRNKTTGGAACSWKEREEEDKRLVAVEQSGANFPHKESWPTHIWVTVVETRSLGLFFFRKATTWVVGYLSVVRAKTNMEGVYIICVYTT